MMNRMILLTLACLAALTAAQSTDLPNPCMTVKCMAGKVCETTRDGTAQCVELTVAPALEPIPVTLNACASTSCPAGAKCVEENGVGRCQMPSDQPKCKPNQVFRECSETCEPKCGEYEPVRACPAVCGSPKCQCDVGFYINSVGDCVNKSDCDLDASSSITCANIDCVSGFICEMKDGKPTCRAGAHVTCDGFDCDVGHHCEILDTAPRCIADVTCENVDCRSGMVCEMEKGKPKCVNKVIPLITCENHVCPSIKVCEMRDGKPTCVNAVIPLLTCENTDCASGKICEMKDGVPTCVNKVVPLITCENVDCKSGMVCKMKKGKPTCVRTTALTCETVDCADGLRCAINPDGAPECIPKLTCANIRCAGECRDTPRGPVCGPRPTPDSFANRSARSPIGPLPPLSCEGFDCLAGYICTLKPVECPTCALRAKCVRDNTSVQGEGVDTTSYN